MRKIEFYIMKKNGHVEEQHLKGIIRKGGVTRIFYFPKNYSLNIFFRNVFFL